VIIYHAHGVMGTKEILLHQSHMYIDISFGMALLSLKNVGGWSLCITDSAFVCIHTWLQAQCMEWIILNVLMCYML